MAIKINKNLNLALEVEREEEPSFFVHSEPVGADIYDANYRVLSKLISSMYEDGLRPLVQSRIAYKALRDLMAEMDPESARHKSAQALIAEIVRLTNVVMPMPSGYHPMPLTVAQKEMDPRDYDEVLNYITFFTAISWVHTKQELKDSLVSNNQLEWRARYVIERYGIHEILEDADAGREYWREGDSIIHRTLGWMMRHAFQTTCRYYTKDGQWDYATPYDYRNRHLIDTLRVLVKTNAG